MLSEVQDSYLPALELAGQNISLLDKVKQDLVFAATTGEPSMVDDAQKLAFEMKKNVADMQKIQDSANTVKQGEIKAISNSLASYLDTVIPLTRAMIAGTADMGQAQASMKRSKDSLQLLEKELVQIRDESRGDFVNAVQEINARSNKVLGVGLFMGVVVMVLLFGPSLIF